MRKDLWEKYLSVEEKKEGEVSVTVSESVSPPPSFASSKSTHHISLSSVAFIATAISASIIDAIIIIIIIINI